MTMSYAHLSAAHRANAVNQIDAVFGFLRLQDVPAQEQPAQALTVTSSM